MGVVVHIGKACIDIATAVSSLGAQSSNVAEARTKAMSNTWAQLGPQHVWWLQYAPCRVGAACLHTGDAFARGGAWVRARHFPTQVDLSLHIKVQRVARPRSGERSMAAEWPM